MCIFTGITSEEQHGASSLLSTVHTYIILHAKKHTRRPRSCAAQIRTTSRIGESLGESLRALAGCTAADSSSFANMTLGAQAQAQADGTSADEGSLKVLAGGMAADNSSVNIGPRLVWDETFGGTRHSVPCCSGRSPAPMPVPASAAEGGCRRAVSDPFGPGQRAGAGSLLGLSRVDSGTKPSSMHDFVLRRGGLFAAVPPEEGALRGRRRCPEPPWHPRTSLVWTWGRSLQTL